ncbi:MAG: hypothetical protein R3337_00030 [Gammaproteobacteria bacterium]|nr:hypothetical protein [Gammaproteobacteria bacterium]
MRALIRLIEFFLEPTKYHGRYVCTVERQSEDWSTLDLTPDEPKIRSAGLQAVPIWHGLPGVEVRVAQGSRVMLGFRDGDPSKPFASLWEYGQVEQIRFGGGEAPLARVGDPVTVYWPTSMTFVGELSGNPFVGTMTITTTAVGIIGDGTPRLTG